MELSINNPTNQIYLYKFFPLFFKHVGMEEKVAFTIQKALKNNEKLLTIINKLLIFNQEFDEPKNIIFLLIERIRKYHLYTKYEILDILAIICRSEENSFYLNQEIIFRNLFYNEHFETILFKINYENDEFLINVKEGKDYIPYSLTDFSNYFGEESNQLSKGYILI